MKIFQFKLINQLLLLIIIIFVVKQNLVTKTSKNKTLYTKKYSVNVI